MKMKSFHSKPHCQSMVDNQRLAYHRLTKETRSEIERNSFERSLAPICADDVELPKAPLVRIKNIDSPNRYVLLCEISQLPGSVVLMNIYDKALTIVLADTLELVSPPEIETAWYNKDKK